jgi:hypothetical protein
LFVRGLTVGLQKFLARNDGAAFLERDLIAPATATRTESGATDTAPDRPSSDQQRVWHRLLRLVSDADTLAHLDTPEIVSTDEAGQTLARPHPKRLRAEADIALVEALETAGVTSASQVAALPERRFVATFADADGIEPERLREVHRRAVRRRNGLHNLVETVRGRIASPFVRALRADNLPTETESLFTDIPSYQEMFGGLNYEVCTSCQSVLGPAAYFLDVMDIIDEYITVPNSTIPAGYTLRDRRPDLFGTPLDCASTNDPVPLLRIASSVVEQQIEKATGSVTAYRDLAVASFPNNLPFNLPLSELREYLIAAGGTLSACYGAFLGQPPATPLVTADQLADEVLGLSQDEVALLTTPDATPAGLAARYGFRAEADLTQLEHVSVFTKRTGLAFTQLVELLTQQLSKTERSSPVADALFINATGESLPPLAIVTETVGPDAPYQKLINVSNARYDRLDRFIRLHRRFEGDFAQLDWAMKAAKAAEITSGFLANLASVTELRAAFAKGWDELASLQHVVKPIGRGDGRTPIDLFDRVFNNPRLLDGRDPYASDTPFDPARTYDWTVAETSGTSGQLRSRLAGALGLSNADTARLGAYVAALQDVSTGVLKLDLDTLSCLYRLALSARLLKLDLSSFFLVASLTFYPGVDPATPPKGVLAPTLATFEALRRTITSTRAAPFTLAQLQYIYTGVAGPSVSIGYRPAQIGTFINDLALTSEGQRVTAQSLMFETIDEEVSERVFKALQEHGFLTKLGISLPKALSFDALSFLFPLDTLSFVQDGLIDAAQSAEAFNALVATKLIVPDPTLATTGVLAGAYTPDTPLDFLFDGQPMAEAMRQQVREDLDQVDRNIRNTLLSLARARVIQLATANSGLAEFLDATPEIISLLLTFATGAADVQDYLAALLTPLEGQPPPQDVVDMIALLARANMLFVALDYSATEIHAVVASPETFGVEDTTALTLDGVWSLTDFRRLVTQFQDVNDELVRCYFEIAPTGTCSNGAGVAALASLTGWPQAEITRLIALFWPPEDPPQDPPGWKTVAGLVRMDGVFQLSRTTALGVEGLSGIAKLAGLKVKGPSGLDETAWAAFDVAATATRDALAARYGQNFDAIYADVEAKLLTTRRDALNGYAVWVLGGVKGLEAIDTIGALSDYLLIDLEMCGCDTTSLIAQGIASLHAYMMNARMNLEPGVTRVLVPESWWSWLSAYRMWEANRKIYLYPENYVDPELLRGASPIYDEFKDEILQNEIDEPHVAEAYTGYFTRLAEQSNLLPISTYLSADIDARTGEEIETHYFFGRSSTEPYAYYHRSRSALGVWTPWRGIDLTINAPALSAAHAFGRLLIFWVETANESGAAIKEGDASPQFTVNSTLRYSFVDASGGWIQPQTLVSDYVVAVHPNGYLDTFQPASASAYLKAQYDEKVLWWSLPHVYKLDRGLTGAGRITFTGGLNLAAGVDTLFEQQIKVGDRIRSAAQERTVTAIEPGVEPFQGAGKITFTANFNAVSGDSSTDFTAQIQVNDQIRAGGETRKVIDVEPNQLLVEPNWTVGGALVDYTIIPATASPPQLVFDQNWTLGASRAKYVVLPKDPAQARFPPFRGAGKITFLAGLDLVSGSVDSRFATQISVGDQISANGETRVVILVDAQNSPPQLVMDLAWGVSGSAVDYMVGPGGIGVERLLVAYGSPIDSAQAPPAGDRPIPKDNPGRDNYLTEFNQFNQDLHATLVLADRARTFSDPGGGGSLAGQATGGYAMQLTEALEGAEARVLSMNWQYAGALTPNLRPYKAVIDRNNSILRVAESDNSFSDNYWSAAAPVQSQPVAGASSGTPILYNIPSFASWITPISNRVGAFAFGFGTESYLAESTEPGLLRLSQTTFTEAYPTSAGNLNEQLVSASAYTAQPIPFQQLKFAFTRLSTSVVDRLSRRLAVGGLDGLIALDSQYLPELPFNRFYSTVDGQPGPALDTTRLPPDLMDFNGAYGLYFWEVFFYNVFLIADRLRGNQRFDAAKAWYEKIFNPTQPAVDGEPEASAEDRWWRFRPFRGLTPESLVEILTNPAQIAIYENDPYDPHAIARLRPGAYPKAIVMRYVANLIDWGDRLFAQDTRETITQASQLYILADELLGPRPIAVGARPPPAPKSYDDIKAAYGTKGAVVSATADTVTLDAAASSKDHFYNGLTISITAGSGVGQMRTIASYDGATRTARLMRRWSDPFPTAGSSYAMSGIPPFYIDLENSGAGLAGVMLSDAPFNDLSTYFCVPENADLMAYWDRIEDRLFKIRHCMNIDGVERSLALFAPPIDPAALVRAAAAGALSPTGGILAEPSVPYYRFDVMIEKARGAAAGVAQLGAALLGALEKQDAEELALIRNAQETALLRLTTQIKEQQIEEVVATGVGLDDAYQAAKDRYDYYTALLAEGLSAGEVQSLDAMAAALAFNILASVTKTASAIGYAVPQAGSPFAMTYGGAQIGASLQAAGEVFEIGGAVATYISQRSLTTAGYDRRAEEWGLQQRLASRDMAQAQAQIDANKIRLQIAERELVVHRQQIADTAAIDAFLTRKFTNKALYQWMAGQLSRLYFQSYTLAFDLARSAERAFQYELGSDKTFLAFGYWDSLKKGLTAGESLSRALDQLDAAYLNGSVRPYEIERTVALSQLDPIALMRLKETGLCEFALTEKLFDQDYPGHYMRQIASLSVSIPAVIGPYQNFRATLTQLSDTVVLSADPQAVAFLLGGDTEATPTSLRTNWWPNQQVALSSGLNDAGVFELNFGDRRYLPFERTGAVSNWRLSIPPQTNPFDFATLTDVILTLRYTALDGGSKFRREVTQLPEMATQDGAVFLPLRQYYPDAWRQFMTVHPSAETQTLAFQVPPSVIPAHLQEPMLKGFFLQLYLAEGETVTAGADFITFNASDEAGGSVDVTLTIQANATHAFPTPLAFGGVVAGPRTLIFDLAAVPADLKKDGFLDPAKVVGIGLVLDYQATIDWK